MLRFFEVFKVIFLKVFFRRLSRQVNVNSEGGSNTGWKSTLKFSVPYVDATAYGLDPIQELRNVLWGIPAARCCPLTGDQGLVGWGT